MINHYGADQRNKWLLESPPNCRPELMAGHPECVKCGGHGFEYVDIGRFQCVKYCGCTKGTIRHAKDIIGIPQKFMGCTLNNYDTTEPEKAHAARLARAFVQKWPDVKKGILFLGPNGTGKTHLAVAVARELAKVENDVHFVDVPNLFAKIRGEYSENRGTTIEPYKHCNILVLDEVGAGKPNDYYVDVLNELLLFRYNEDRITIITTNAANTDELADKLDRRVADRLNEMCAFVPVLGRSYRKGK